MSRRTALAAVLGGMGAVALSCSSGGGRAADGTVDVVASFYPLAFAAQRIGGDRVTVTNLTPPGVEPHDLELAPDDVARISEADLVVYLDGFSPAVDDAIRGEAGDRGFDAGRFARLDLPATPGEEGARAEGEPGTDPHFWLDPLRLADVADALAARLADADPQDAGAFRANAATLRSELEALDAGLAAGLATCANRDLVTSHDAFGYLADRYGLRQVGITGLAADAEPTPADLAGIVRFVKDNDVRTVYSETLVSPAVADAVAEETGAVTAVLDPLEGLADDASGDGPGSGDRAGGARGGADYFSVMRSNLATLRAGQGCS